MSLTGEKVGIPEAEEAPVVMTPRLNQPLAGLASLIIVFLITIGLWVSLNGILGYSATMFWWSLLGSFGLMVVLFAIWFENWPAYKLRTPWKVGLAGTILNIVGLVILVILSGVYALMYPGYEVYAFSVFGALSASCFSFGVLWVAGTMYWPFFDKRQPRRGAYVFVVGMIVTGLAWFLLFYPSLNTTTGFNSTAYGLSLGWTQWTIFFSLLTLMTFEYWPWNRLGKQPEIGIAAFVSCAVLGYVMLVVAGILVTILAPLMSAALGIAYPDPVTNTALFSVGVGYMNVAIADWLIVGVVVVSLFFDNWPKGYTQTKNFAVRLVLVVVIGAILFLLYYPLSNFVLMGPGNPWYDTPTAFLVLFLWIQLLFAYVWRKWPIYRPLE